MSFAALRAPVRRAAFAPVARSARAPVRTSFRKYSTPPTPESKGSFPWLAVALGGVGAIAGSYLYNAVSSGQDAGTAVKSGVQAAKVAANFVPSKEDYQKVGETSAKHSKYVDSATLTPHALKNIGLQ